MAEYKDITPFIRDLTAMKRVYDAISLDGVLFAASLGIHLAKHGTPKTGTYSIGTAMLSLAIECALLWWGGFWK